jgi:hypothetical protein
VTVAAPSLAVAVDGRAQVQGDPVLDELDLLIKKLADVKLAASKPSRRDAMRFGDLALSLRFLVHFLREPPRAAGDFSQRLQTALNHALRVCREITTAYVHGAAAVAEVKRRRAASSVDVGPAEDGDAPGGDAGVAVGGAVRSRSGSRSGGVGARRASGRGAGDDGGGAGGAGIPGGDGDGAGAGDGAGEDKEEDAVSSAAEGMSWLPRERSFVHALAKYGGCVDCDSALMASCV